MSVNQINRYKHIESAKGVTKDGVLASFQTFESSDGITLFVRTEFFRSAASMERQFKTKVNNLSDLIGGNDTHGTKGKLKQKRVVGRIIDAEGRQTFSIMWKHNNRISYIESTSLNHALDFEKNFYKSEK